MQRAPHTNRPRPATAFSCNGQSGNIIFFVLMAIVLIGLVTMALRDTGDSNGQIDAENMSIAASDVRQYVHELESAVAFVLQNNASEADIRFAHDATGPYGDITTDPHPEFQVFSPKGGGAEYRAPPAGIATDPNQQWEFYAHTAIPGAGSERADLVAVLPHVTRAFCERINQVNDQQGIPADDGTGCVNDTAQRFLGTYNDSSANVLDEGTFSHLPALQACINCSPGTPETPDYVFYDVLMAR